MTKVNIHKQTNELRSKRKHPLLLWGIGIGIRYWWLFILIEKALEMGIASCQLHTRTDTQIAYEKTNRTRTNYRIFKIKETKFHQYFNFKKKNDTKAVSLHTLVVRREKPDAVCNGGILQLFENPKPITHELRQIIQTSHSHFSALCFTKNERASSKLQFSIYQMVFNYIYGQNPKAKALETWAWESFRT